MAKAVIRAASRTDDCQDLVGTIVAAAVPGATMTRRPCPYTTSYRLEEIEAKRSGEPTLRFTAKHLGWQGLTEAGRRAKPVTLHSTERELAVYRDILARADLATPGFIGGWAGHDTGVLVLERVEGTPLTEIGDFGAWEAAARWLARMHTTFAAEPRATASRGYASLLRYDGDLLDRAGRLGLARADERGFGSAADRAALARAHRQGLRALANRTLVHGDFYPSNIIVAGDRIAVVDWELAGIGPGELDLAALAAGKWEDAQRCHLVRAYHEEAAVLGPTEPFDALFRRFTLASVHLALRWLGAPPGWRPPGEHERDWFADAVSALAHLDGVR